MMYMETPDLITTDAEKPGRRTCLVRRPGFLYLFLAGKGISIGHEIRPLYKQGAWEVQAQRLPDDLLGFKDGVFPGVLLLSRRR